MVFGTGPWHTLPRTFFFCNADSKDKGNFATEREVEKQLLRAAREESQINSLAKKLKLPTTFKGPSAFLETGCLTLRPGSAAGWEVPIIALLCGGKREHTEWFLPTALQVSVVWSWKYFILGGLMVPSLFNAGEPSYFSSIPATLLIVLQSIIHSWLSIDL